MIAKFKQQKSENRNLRNQVQRQQEQVHQLTSETEELKKVVTGLKILNERLERKTDAESAQLRSMLMLMKISDSWRKKRHIEDFIFTWLMTHVAFSEEEVEFLNSSTEDQRLEKKFSEIRTRIQALQKDLDMGPGKPIKFLKAIARLMKKARTS